MKTKFEREYIKWYNGKQLSIYYDGGYFWSAWLEGVGGIGGGINADAALDSVNTKLGTSFTERDFMSFENGRRVG